jgi:D-amino peptidase
MSRRSTYLLALFALSLSQPACDPPGRSRKSTEDAAAAAAEPEGKEVSRWKSMAERDGPPPEEKKPPRPRPSTEGGLKIYVSVDMEGIAGVVTGAQLGPEGFEYQRFREFMTAEVNAVIDAAYVAGAREVLVSDSHGNGENLLIDRLPPEVQVVRSWPRPLGMMAGIDETFHGVIFLGYHTGTTNPKGVRAHTFSSSKLADVRMNEMSMSEAHVNAAIAGHFGVPVIMVSGDDACVQETRAVLGDIEGAVVKWSLGFHSARTLTPEAARAEIGRKVTAAMARIEEFEPYVLETPVEVEVWFKYNRPSEVLAYLPMFERVGSRGVHFTAEDVAEASRFLRFITTYDPNLKP